MDDQTGRVTGTADLDQDSEHRAREIRADIERTREDLAETVEAIQEKLRPTNVAASVASATTERVKAMAHNAADRADDFMTSSGGYRFVDRMMANPFPLALTVIGATWLLAGSDSRRRGYASEHEYPSQHDYSSGREYSSRRDYTRTGEYVGNRREGSPSMRSAGRMLERSGRQVRSMVRDYPLAVGAAALIVGASLGMAVPETETENELMGEARDATLKRAQDAASGAIGQVKEATADVVTRAALGD